MYGAYDNSWLVRALNWPNHFILSPLSNKLECAGLLIRHLSPIEPWYRSFSDQTFPFLFWKLAQSVQGCREINSNTIALWPVFQVLFISSYLLIQPLHLIKWCEYAQCLGKSSHCLWLGQLLLTIHYPEFRYQSVNNFTPLQ